MRLYSSVSSTKFLIYLFPSSSRLCTWTYRGVHIFLILLQKYFKIIVSFDNIFYVFGLIFHLYFNNNYFINFLIEVNYLLKNNPENILHHFFRLLFIFLKIYTVMLLNFIETFYSNNFTIIFKTFSFVFSKIFLKKYS